MTAAGLLSGVPLFAGLASPDVGELEKMLRTRTWMAGETVFRAGDDGSSLYIVSSGSVKIAVTSPDGREKALAVLGPGEFFGELSLLDGQPRSADAVTLEDSTLHMLPGEQFRLFLRARPDACLGVMAALSLRLRRTDELVQDTAFMEIPCRLAKAILQLGVTRGGRGRQGQAVTPRMSQSEIAALVGATRESVNKWLRRFEGQGLLRLDNGRIAVSDPAGLGRYACRGSGAGSPAK